MLRDGKIQLGEFNLSVAADKPPAAYSQLSSDVALPNLKWIDGHKPVFRVNVSMVSSIHPKVRDTTLHTHKDTPSYLTLTNKYLSMFFSSTVHVGHSPS